MKEHVAPHLLRIGLRFDEKDESQLEELLRLLRKYPSGISEIAFFTSNVHIPYPLEEVKRRIGIIKKYIRRCREEGLRAGFNHLATLGHHEEDLEWSIPGNYTHMTNRRGEKCRGSYCMNDEAYLREYVVPLYTALAKAEPDFILVDDDIRYYHMPVGTGCFCDTCIEKFNSLSGLRLTRYELLSRLDGGDAEIRKLWLEKQSLAIENLLALIGDTVRSVNENITLGVMSGERYAEGYRFDRWAEALSSKGRYEIMWRPGGGAYTDSRFDEIVRKAEQTGRQNAFLPEYVTKRQYEIESFPHHMIKKTPTSTALEAAWAMTSGNSGAAFNILPAESGEPWSVAEPHLRAICRMLPMYDLLAEKTAKRAPVGIGSAWRRDSLASAPKGDFTGQSGDIYADFSREFFDFGLPEAYHPDNCLVLLGKGEFAYSYTDGEIEALLTKNIYLDTAALSLLNRRGYSNLTGFEIQCEFPADAREEYIPHEINAGGEGDIRNGKQSFCAEDSFGLVPHEGAHALTRLVDYHGRVLSDCALGIFENETGGRIAAAGYYPYSRLADYYKSRQIINLMLYLSGGKLPSYVDSYIRIRNHTFVDGDRITVALLNPTNEPYENVDVAVLGDRDVVHVYTKDGECRASDRTRRAETHSIFTVGEIPPYSIVIIETV
jgi:hypothetical protein